MGRLRVLSASVAFWQLACGGDRTLGDYPLSTCDLAEPPAEFSNEPLSISTFWADSHEQAALEQLRRRIDSRYRVKTEQNGTRVEVQRQLSDEFESRQLPDVFQVNGGSDVLRWVQHRSAEGTDVCALDRLSDAYGWRDAYFPAALAPLSCDGRLYGLPVGIHRVNVLFYNRDLFSTLAQRARDGGVELTSPAELKNTEQLLSMLGQVAELAATTPSGKTLVPLAIGAESEWPLTVLAFENVLLSLGHQAYETLWLGGLADAAPEQASELRATLADMLSVLRNLLDYSNASARISWQDALRQVGDGEALMTITGDWGYAQLDAEVIAGVATSPFPGTAGTFVYTPDSFSVPRELHKDGFPARSFLHDIVEDTAALIDFSNAKHSIPPRRDLSQLQIDALGSDSLRSTYRQFASCNDSSDGCQLLLAVSGLAPPPGSDACFDEMDALLTYAVTGNAPAPSASTRLCGQPFPTTSAKAESQLLDLLLKVAERRFAADCR